MTNPHQDLEDQIGIQKQVLEYKLKNQARRRAEARALITKGQAILDELDQKVASNQASIERMTQELGKRQAMTLGPWEEDHSSPRGACGSRYSYSSYHKPKDRRDWLDHRVWLRVMGGDERFWTATVYHNNNKEIKYDPPRYHSDETLAEDWEKFKKLTDEKLVEMGYYLIDE